MNYKTIANGILLAIAIVVLTLLSLLFVYKIQVIIIYLVVALVLSLITAPFVNFFKKRFKFSNVLAVVLALGGVVIVFIGLIWLFVPLIVEQSQNLSLLDTKKIEQDFVALINTIDTFLLNHHINTNKLLNPSKIIASINFNFVPTILNSVVGTIGNLAVAIGSIFFITFFFLKDKEIFITLVKKILPDQHEEKILLSIKKTNDLLSRYFIGLLLQLCIVFILYVIVLLIFGIKNAVIIAFLCAILNIIPYIGPLIASVLAAILTMLNYLGSDFQNVTLPNTLYVLLGFWVVQLIDNNISQPIIFSKSVNSHPLEIFLVIIASGILFGVVGMIIAVPFYTMLKVIAKEFFPDNKIIQIITSNL